MPALDLKPFHIIEWLDAHTTWGPTYRRNAITAIQRAFNWAEELGHITTNPIRKMKKPAAKRREHFITPADWEVIRNHYPEGDPFRELLEFAWESGCRPQEARHIETRHVHLDRGVIAIPPEESKGRKKWRVIRLEGRAAEIAAKRLPRATDKLFVNADGKPWTPYAMNCRFCRLQKTLGVKHFAYAFRHGFANRLLVSGADHLTVAELLGHADGTMLARVYQHLDSSDAHLRKALRRAGGSGDSEVPKS
ncbi:tyrosine-type recombinase/integrase [Gemmata massiliana]|nr:tyrosine-type recombinase/integrase [Gemmata massiliana]